MEVQRKVQVLDQHEIHDGGGDDGVNQSDVHDDDDEVHDDGDDPLLMSCYCYTIHKVRLTNRFALICYLFIIKF